MLWDWGALVPEGAGNCWLCARESPRHPSEPASQKSGSDEPSQHLLLSGCSPSSKDINIILYTASPLVVMKEAQKKLQKGKAPVGIGLSELCTERAL
ncbi:UNVERIFIED_CONTAM: hypothetical protein K2H54_043465 [Gekko kuhli]